MTVTRYNPRTIHLGGDVTWVNDLPTSEAITPGHLIERHSEGGAAKFRKHTTAGGDTAPIFALNQPELNLGIDDNYADGDLMSAAFGHRGSTFYAIIGSGVNVAAGAQLESAGDGTLRALASGVPLATAIEDTDNSAGPGTMRCRVEVI